MDGNEVVNPRTRLRAALLEAVREFVEHRRKHGGILLPDRCIIDQEYMDVLYQTGVVKEPARTVMVERNGILRSEPETPKIS